MSNLVLNIEFIIWAQEFILDTRTSYLLASDWFINKGVEWCMEVETYKRNSNEKYYLYFQRKYSVRIISSLS